MGLSFNSSYTPGSAGYTAASLIDKLGGPSSSHAAFKVTSPDIPAPEAPDYSELLAAYGAVPGVFNPRKVLKNYDSAITASNLSTAQQGRNAGLSYTNRLMQTGVAPVAGGVVEAMGRRAGNENTRALMSEREQLAMSARKESMNLQAMIADKLANIRDSYTKTVADYNSRKANMEFTADSTNAGNELKATEMEQSRQAQAAELAARMAALEGSGSGSGKGGAGAIGTNITDPHTFATGYIPNMGMIQPGTGYLGANGHNVLVGWGA